MPTLTAIRETKYATRRLLPGDTFECSDKDAPILVGTRKAKYAPVQPKVVAKVVEPTFEEKEVVAPAPRPTPRYVAPRKPEPAAAVVDTAQAKEPTELIQPRRRYGAIHPNSVPKPSEPAVDLTSPPVVPEAE